MNKNVPIVTSGYKLTVVEPPAPKTRDDGQGGQVVVTDRQGVTQFVVSLFAKLRVDGGVAGAEGGGDQGDLGDRPGRRGSRRTPGWS